MNDQDAALAAFPDLQRLIDMRDAGWHFKLVAGPEGAEVKGLYVWQTTNQPWGDMIQIRDENDAAAIRLNPLRDMVWQYEGSMVGAINALLELPHPDSANAPHLVIGTLRELWTP